MFPSANFNVATRFVQTKKMNFIILVFFFQWHHNPNLAIYLSLIYLYM